MTRPAYYLPPAQERAIRRALRGGATRDEAAAAAGITRSLLDTRLRDQLADVRVGRGRGGGRPTEDDGGDWDISVEEIYRRAAALRAEWTPEEEAARYNSNFSGPDADATM